MRTFLSFAAVLTFCLPSVAGAVGEELVSLELCTGIADRKGTGCGVAFPEGTSVVHVLLAVRIPPGNTGSVQVEWRYGDRPTQRQTLAIKAYRKTGWRTRARQRIAASRTGAWSVQIKAEDGSVLATRAFSIGGPAEAAPIEPTPAEPAAVEPAAPAPDAGTPIPDAAPVTPDAAPAAPDAAPAPSDAAPAPSDAAPTRPDAAAGDSGGIDLVIDPAELAETDDGGAGVAPVGDPEDLPEPPVDPSAAPVAEPANDPSAVADPAPDPTPAVDAPPTRAPAPTGASEGSEPDPAAKERKSLGLILLIGGVALLITGLVVSKRRRAARVAPVEAPIEPIAGVVVAAAVVDEAAATEALQRLADLVTDLWSRWVSAAGGSPQDKLTAAWRTVSEPGRLGLDHVQLCNALEQAATAYASLPPKGTSADILRIRLFDQASTLLNAVCGLATECERLDLADTGLDEAMDRWDGRPGLTAELLGILDAGAAALGTTRLHIVPYETKATTAKREFGVDLKPFTLPANLVERLGAGSRVVRVDTAPFSDGPTPVVRGHAPA